MSSQIQDLEFLGVNLTELASEYNVKDTRNLAENLIQDVQIITEILDKSVPLSP